MSEIVCGVVASHTTLMNTRWAEVDHLAEAHAYRDSLADARSIIERSGADVAVVVGPNHFRGFWLDLMPTFTVGVADVLGAGEHGTPAGPLPTDPQLALGLHTGLLDEGFDPAMSLRLTVDHGVTHAVQYVIPDGMPVVPVIVNSFAPPLPTLDRCRIFGEALGRVLSRTGDSRVAVIGSGGLSHRLPFPDWRSPGSDDDEFLVSSWIEGRNDWERFEERRRSIVVAARPDLNPEFDTWVLDRWAAGEFRDLLRHEDDLVELAGNGANEVRNWLVCAAACGFAPGRTLSYAPIDEWLTGMGSAVIESPLPVAAP